MASSRTPYQPRPIGRSEASSLASSSSGVFPLPKKCPALYRTHHRSSPIPIQRSAGVAKVEEIIDLVPDYDKATWRMYNRIVEYRQKHNVTYMTEEESQKDDNKAIILEKDSTRDSHLLPVCPEHSLLTDTSSDHNDEIFQLDE